MSTFDDEAGVAPISGKHAEKSQLNDLHQIVNQLMESEVFDAGLHNYKSFLNLKANLTITLPEKDLRNGFSIIFLNTPYLSYSVLFVIVIRNIFVLSNEIHCYYKYMKECELQNKCIKIVKYNAKNNFILLENGTIIV